VSAATVAAAYAAAVLALTLAALGVALWDDWCDVVAMRAAERAS
jgi:hypothetical protein